MFVLAEQVVQGDDSLINRLEHDKPITTVTIDDLAKFLTAR